MQKRNRSRERTGSGHTLAEKILMNNTGIKNIKPGDIVITKPDIVMFHDIYTPFVYNKFKEMEFKEVWDKDKIAIMLDHLNPTCLKDDPRHLRYGYKFAEEFGIKNFHDGEGISHQLMPQMGYAKPGQVVYVTDSHTTTYGAVGCFATGIGHTEMASILGTGEMWVKVPNAIKIQIDGILPKYVSSKDIILKVLGDIKADGGTYKSLEFCGTAIDALSVDSRLTISNMVVECGGKVGLFAPDKKTCEYSKVNYEDVKWLCFDEDANYEKVLYYKAEELVPQVSCPQYVDNVHPINEVEGLEINQVFLGSCTNGRLEDLEIAAKILKGKKINPFVKFIVSPASNKIFKEAIKLGYIETLAESGAMITHSYCSLCQGRSGGLVSDGEVVLGTNNRNFLGRMGSAKSLIYLSSPAVAAASVITGRITDPRKIYL
ncbi:MAG: 3-isopropylmalate dehydratase large subunit [Clostridium luticellarii]|nr:3-isopropylmalate dehydratase large subunit [Clostridium luticellarii]MCI1945499.1 3-isopropylmalate dehydratase large subunit [Clostridium luticellarii]